MRNYSMQLMYVEEQEIAMGHNPVRLEIARTIKAVRYLMHQQGGRRPAGMKNKVAVAIARKSLESRGIMYLNMAR